MENYHEINYEKNMKVLSQAIKHCEQELSHEEIIRVLQGEDDIEKQLRLIELKAVYNQEEANILVFNLTQHSGPVRETAAYKISELIAQKEFAKFFQTEKIMDTFVKAIVDINPSVSRSSVEIIRFVENAQYIYESIIEELNRTLSQIDIEVKNRSYVQNKKNFNLYWNLEALINIADLVNADEYLLKILKTTAESNDYTIREKTAKAAQVFGFADVIDFLKDDTNVYVKKYLN